MENIRKLIVNPLSDLDKLIGTCVLVLMLIGVFGVFSASTRIDEKYDLLFKKHIIFCFLAFILICSLSKLNLKNLIIFSIFIFFVAILLSFSTFFFFKKLRVQTDG